MRDMNSLETATSLELIEELIRRQHFVGMVIYSSEKDLRTPRLNIRNVTHDNFTLQTTVNAELTAKFLAEAHTQVIGLKNRPPS